MAGCTVEYMKKTEIKVGEEYAAGSSSRYYRWRLAHIRVLDLNAERGSHRGKAILVELIEDSRTYGFYGKAGETKLLDSARGIIKPWAEYIEVKRKNDEAQAEAKAERKRRVGVAANVKEVLEGYGFHEGFGGDYRYESTSQHFRFSPERLAELLRVIEQRKAA